MPVISKKERIGWTPTCLFIGYWPMIMSATILVLAPPLGIFEVFWAISRIYLLHNCQILEDSVLGISQSRIWCLGKLRYLISKKFFHHVGSLIMSLQTIFPPRAKLRMWCIWIESFCYHGIAFLPLCFSRCIKYEEILLHKHSIPLFLWF